MRASDKGESDHWNHRPPRQIFNSMHEHTWKTIQVNKYQVISSGNSQNSLPLKLLLFKINPLFQGYSSGLEHLPSMHKALGSPEFQDLPFKIDSKEKSIHYIIFSICMCIIVNWQKKINDSVLKDNHLIFYFSKTTYSQTKRSFYTCYSIFVP